MTFSDKILKWYADNRRDLPWRNTRDPYKIWLSEIILQQTRIAQGMPYYLDFISKYPSILNLAEADEQQVLKTWQGLGYYSRARNLHATAQQIAFEQNGMFPESYDELLKLKGIGDYTASAIASICFGENRPVVDGNVYRVLSRCFDVSLPIDSSKGKRFFKDLAIEIMPSSQTGDYNQGIMELGATVCLPRSPSCHNCPLNDQCLALERNSILERPVKKKRTPTRHRYFNYLIFLDPKHHTLVQKRTDKDIWRNLFEFPLIETKRPEDMSFLKRKAVYSKAWPAASNMYHLQEMDRLHKLSHQTLHARFWVVQTDQIIPGGVPVESLEEYPVPVLIQDALQTFKNSYF